MPGNYNGEYRPGDVANGALYDRAVWLYAMGRMGPLNDDMGQTVIAYLREQHPDFRPAAILDMGCTVGHSTLPYAEHFPDAELHGIDLGAPVLRYAHARAEAMGRKVHFSQQNAERTNFADESFDLVVSHILVHETSHKAIRNIVQEAHRVLKPGGLMIHVETPPYRAMSDFDACMLDWDTRNNNEPFWGAKPRDRSGRDGGGRRLRRRERIRAQPAERVRPGRPPTHESVPGRRFRRRRRMVHVGRQEARMKSELPRKAKGDRPVYLDEGAIDQLLAMVMTLSGELVVLRERLDTAERLLGEDGRLKAAIDAYRPSAEVGAEREAWRARFLDLLLTPVRKDYEALEQTDGGASDSAVAMVNAGE